MAQAQSGEPGIQLAEVVQELVDGTLQRPRFKRGEAGDQLGRARAWRRVLVVLRPLARGRLTLPGRDRLERDPLVAERRDILSPAARRVDKPAGSAPAAACNAGPLPGEKTAIGPLSDPTPAPCEAACNPDVVIVVSTVIV